MSWFRRSPPPSPPRIEPIIKPWRIDPSAAAFIGRDTTPERVNPFKLPDYAPGVLPKGATMAMDQAQCDQITAGFNFAFNNLSAFGNQGLFHEGIGFFGYPYLSELAQRPEYRTPSELMAEEATRKWCILKSVGDTDKSEKIKQLTADMAFFRLRKAFRDATMLDGLMGLCPINIDVGTWNDPEEMATPLLLDKAKIKKGDLKGFRVVDPIWIAPTNYNSSNPLDPFFYKPQTWFVTGMRVHASRFLIILARPVPDLLKPAYNFGGLSFSQMLMPYVQNWLRTRQSVSDLISAFTSWVLKTDLMTSIQPGGDGGASLDYRLSLFTAMLNNRGMMAINKDTEEFDNVSVPLGGLDSLQAQSQEHMAAVMRAPLIKYFGITPTGLNASTDGEVRSWYDNVHAYQEFVYNDHMKTALDVLQLNRYGEIDPEIVHEWVPLWELDEAGRAAVQKIKADTDSVLSQEGAIGPDDIRGRVVDDPQSPYFEKKGEAPGLPEQSEDPNLTDPSEKIGAQGAEGSETEANSGV